MVKTLVNSNISIMNNIIKQSFGLMFKKKRKEFAMIFEFRKSRRMNIHMMFVFYPIDIIFLNKSGKIIEIKENLKPFRLYNSSSNKIQTFIELPSGFVSKTGLKKGQKIKWTSSKLLLSL